MTILSSTGRIFGGGKGVPVLMYHHVSPHKGAHTVHPDNFRAHLQWLAYNGYRCLTAEEYARFHLQGELPSNRAVLISFDDGWLDIWLYAVPILEAFGAPAAMFVVSSWPGEGEARTGKTIRELNLPGHDSAKQMAADPETRDHVIMRWSELLAAREKGVLSLQSHSHSHGAWWEETSAERILSCLRRDLETSRDVLAMKTGGAPVQLCWPKGQFVRSMAETARNLGFEVQHSTLRGTNLGACGQPIVRRINAENRSEKWLASRVRLYRRPLMGTLLGGAHQFLQGVRFAKQYRGVFPVRNFLSL